MSLVDLPPTGPTAPPRPTAAPTPSSPPAPSAAGREHAEERTSRSDRINQLRAGVLGANDGIVSVAGLAVGVAGATTDIQWLLVAGLAALIAGALSMAMGEYVSVSTQRDTDRALIERTRRGLAEDPAGEHDRLVEALGESGIPGDVVGEVADSLERHDALTAHTRFRHGVEQDSVVSPLSAALASLLAFTLGGIIPLAAILASPPVWRLPATLVAVVVALALLGVVSARLGQADARTATIRTIIGGVLALLVTYGIGAALGVAIS
ncbi:VIT1/CCC1 transporter family protein [Brachybacterium saurashtrense]|uniref:VIT family protein n=1 Tax=Brachybacterium saurashtrense TaxID=556288 RepID=A0A345YSA9_9MICO|nr:VIT1/CCC1 transporter family protein [Brachybacterium saurashtrense]AXK46811.1 VIT family protein [Brachybacterium saurashtrense]RRR22526.1 VIT family protein [Brachybacterium saurashtrense]